MQPTSVMHLRRLFAQMPNRSLDSSRDQRHHHLASVVRNGPSLGSLHTAVYRIPPIYYLPEHSCIDVCEQGKPEKLSRSAFTASCPLLRDAGEQQSIRVELGKVTTLEHTCSSISVVSTLTGRFTLCFCPLRMPSSKVHHDCCRRTGQASKSMRDLSSPRPLASRAKCRYIIGADGRELLARSRESRIGDSIFGVIHIQRLSGRLFVAHC